MDTGAVKLSNVAAFFFVLVPEDELDFVVPDPAGLEVFGLGVMAFVISPAFNEVKSDSSAFSDTGLGGNIAFVGGGVTEMVGGVGGFKKGSSDAGNVSG